MKLSDLGFNENLKAFQKSHGLEGFDIARVSSEHKDRYTVKTTTKDLEAELIGNLRFTAESKRDLPAVGDWVAISEYDEGKALIHAVYPRTSILERKAIAKNGEIQIIATNIDVGLIIQAVNRDFKINRIERYLTICHAAKIAPIVIISKTDLLERTELSTLLNTLHERIKGVEIIALSNATKEGLEAIKNRLSNGKTYCLLGSSGVGKSTLINNLLGVEAMETGAISEAIDRGKHVTTHRELIVSENGILIDNPGMREVGITDSSEGLEMTFDEIGDLAENCRYKNCSHTNEKGCAIIAALESNELDMESYDNFQKMQRERSFFESSKEERKKKDKDFGKMIRQVSKQRKKNKY